MSCETREMYHLNMDEEPMHNESSKGRQKTGQPRWRQPDGSIAIIQHICKWSLQSWKTPQQKTLPPKRLEMISWMQNTKDKSNSTHLSKIGFCHVRKGRSNFVTLCTITSHWHFHPSLMRKRNAPKLAKTRSKRQTGQSYSGWSLPMKQDGGST